MLKIEKYLSKLFNTLFVIGANLAQLFQILKTVCDETGNGKVEVWTGHMEQIYTSLLAFTSSRMKLVSN